MSRYSQVADMMRWMADWCDGRDGNGVGDINDLIRSVRAYRRDAQKSGDVRGVLDGDIQLRVLFTMRWADGQLAILDAIPARGAARSHIAPPRDAGDANGYESRAD